MAEKSKELEDRKRTPTGERNGSEQGGREGAQDVVRLPGHKDDDRDAKETR